MKVLMVGATGRYAHLVLAELVQRGVAVRALVRSKQSAEIAQSKGATEAVLGDLNVPQNAAEAATGNVSSQGDIHVVAQNPGEIVGVALAGSAVSGNPAPPPLLWPGNT